MPDWLIERGIGEDRALLLEADRVVAAKLRWPGELGAGQVVTGPLVTRSAGSSRGAVRLDDGTEILVDRLPKDASEGRPISVEIRRAAVAERGRLKRAQGRPVGGDRASLGGEPDPFATGAPVRRFPPGAWEDVWTAAWDRSIDFAGGSLLLDVTPGMTVVDIDGDRSPRELALAAIPSLARAIRHFDLGGSIAVDFPTLATKADRQAVDSALGEALAGWPHERTAMNGFGMVQLVARLQGPSLLHRLTLHRAESAARYLLRQAEGVEGAGAVMLTAHPAVIVAIKTEWLDELARRTGREVRTTAEPALALGGGHAQIVPR